MGGGGGGARGGGGQVLSAEAFTHYALAHTSVEEPRFGAFMHRWRAYLLFAFAIVVWLAGP